MSLRGTCWLAVAIASLGCGRSEPFSPDGGGRGDGGSTPAACAQPCPGSTRCVGGSCVPLCGVRWVDCHDGSNGVVNVCVLSSNCGACRHVCATNEACQEGVCAECGSGLTHCFAECVDLATARFNCGTCGNVCSGSQQCLAGACTG